MNDPKVVALIYTVGPVNSKRYDKASPLRYCDSSEFDLTVEDKVARFELKKFYASEGEAREAVEPFIEHWEFESAMQGGPGSFSLLYERAKIIDRAPAPPDPGVRKLRAHLRIPAPTISARISYYAPHYPPPPVGGSVDLDDPDAKSMYDRYVNYRSGNELLLSMAYFCLTVLEYRFIGQRPSKRENACQHYHIDKEVLDAVGNLTANKGDLSFARKRAPRVVPLTRQEEKFLKKAVQEMVYRAAQVAADDSQHLPQITMAGLPKL